MPTFYDSHGNPITVNQPVGRGGEGTVYFCPSDLTKVAKIYHEPIDDEKAEKLKWMAANSDERLLKVAAWIIDTLHDAPGGRIVGFLMPNVRAKEIHELYSLKSRRVHFPDATWEFLVHAAANVARAFHNLHRQDHVMGDVNHGNCVVLADGTVKLIDCDSYSIKTDRLRYRCEVGVATHLAPELQGEDLSGIDRTANHDNFGLAIIIFQLLFLGRHPFAGNYLGAEDKSLEECIRERRFAYGDNSESTMVRQPPGTLSLNQVTPRVAALFSRAFLTTERPEPKEWIEALEDLANSLAQCEVHLGHFYFSELMRCPWCQIEGETGLMLFPFITTVKDGTEDKFDIFTVESLLAGIEVPRELKLQTLKQSEMPPPSEAVAGANQRNRKRLLIVSAVQACIVLLMTLIAGAGLGFFVGAIGMVCFLVVFNRMDRSERDALESELYEAQLGWKKIETDWAAQNADTRINHDLDKIRERVSEHQEIQRAGRSRLQLLTEDVRNYKLQHYLSSFEIQRSRFPNVDQRAFDAMQDRDIRTADQITATGLERIPGLNADARTTFLDWRSEIEQGFRFDPATEIPERDQKLIESDFSNRRRHLEREIEQLLVTVRSSAAMVQNRHRVMSARITDLANRLAQAESDLAALGTGTPLIVSLIFITALIPMLGSAFQPAPVGDKGFVYTRPMPAGGGDDFTLRDDYQVIDGLTDEQIERLSSDTKSRSADSLIRKAETMIGLDDYVGAEAKLRYALRFWKTNDHGRFLLAHALFMQSKNEDALAQLNRINGGRVGETDALVLRGRILIGLNRAELALVPLEEALKAESSYDAMVYKGVAYRELGKYNESVKLIQNAEAFEPDRLEATYELGLTYFAFGKISAANQVYQSLLKKDASLASKFQRVTKLPVMRAEPAEVTGIGDGTGK